MIPSVFFVLQHGTHEVAGLASVAKSLVTQDPHSRSRASQLYGIFA